MFLRSFASKDGYACNFGVFNSYRSLPEAEQLFGDVSSCNTPLHVHRIPLSFLIMNSHMLLKELHLPHPLFLLPIPTSLSLISLFTFACFNASPIWSLSWKNSKLLLVVVSAQKILLTRVLCRIISSLAVIRMPSWWELISVSKSCKSCRYYFI